MILRFVDAIFATIFTGVLRYWKWRTGKGVYVIPISSRPYPPTPTLQWPETQRHHWPPRDKRGMN